ncbi:hypothetical protein FNJ84_06480 [Paracoccus sp. M683]|uniref:hypothetical protein n=1 Tax=Paracoccus sp. M683 TaxID=2594268 RepID=UPI00117D8022|nr:hypothetical protein [Paracoccus sp. M683]TRW98416.1 hypothetical protein FNJ84_06480 [Paracoccus sp. M683]
MAVIGHDQGAAGQGDPLCQNRRAQPFASPPGKIAGHAQPRAGDVFTAGRPVIQLQKPGSPAVSHPAAPQRGQLIAADHSAQVILAPSGRQSDIHYPALALPI